MSKINDLIKKLCPNGVPFIQIKEIGQIRMCKRILKSETNTIEGVPFYKIGTFGKEADAFISEEIFNKYKQQYAYPKKGDILISCSGTIGRIVAFDGKPAYFQDSNIVWLEHDWTKVLNEYLKYIYTTQPWQVSTGGTIARLYNDNILNTKIPVPPLEVQCEIVHILDDFTLLSAELSAELKARQKQYEYYRDNLFEFNENIKSFSLKELCLSIKDGMHNLPKSTLNEGNYPILSAQNICDGKVNYEGKRYVDEDIYLKENKRTNIEKGDILLTIVATIGRTAVVEEDNKFLLQRSVCVLKPNNMINPYYLKFYLDTYKVQNYMISNAHGSAQAGLYLNQVADILVPVPEIDKQNKIVDILMNFDKITNDISSGLPAEIEARQKQYEYYRDKLLTFKELKINE